MRNHIPVFLFSIFSFVILGCANQVAPAGGPKDVKPPEIKAMVPENYSANFKSKEIRITFDEFIQLKDLNAQLVVSPPLSTFPETRIHKKTLTIILEDTLKENTTYSMNFGKAIGDLNEGNALDNFSYVFSTGSYLDTLYISGKVMNAAAQKAEKDVKVMIYRDDSDSIPFKSTPLYFGLTNEMGEFRIGNISAGTYKIFALKETNTNYLYDSPDESIAFSGALVQPGEINIQLALFHEFPSMHVQRVYSEEPGKALVVINRPLDDLKIGFIGDTTGLALERIFFSAKKDTAIIWYRNVLRDSLSILAGIPGKMDTATIRLQKADEKYAKKRKFAFGISASVSEQVMVHLKQPVVVSMSHPILSFDKNKISLLEDSVAVTPSDIRFTDDEKQLLEISYPWKENKNYRLVIPAEAFTDIFGLKNDTVKINFRSHQQIDYGSLKLILSATNYPAENIFQLVNEKNETVREISCRRDTVMMLEYLVPGSYRLRLIQDKNKNHKEDSGNYLQKLQPEPVIYYTETITIRANWDVDATWKAVFPE